MQENYFQVEQIIGKQIKKGKVFYFVKWKGYNRDQSTWELEENLGNCRELVEKYEMQIPDKNQQKTKQNIQNNQNDQTIPEYYKTLMRQKKNQQNKRKKRQKKKEISIEIEELSQEQTNSKPKKISKEKLKQKDKSQKKFQDYNKFFEHQENNNIQIDNKIESIRIDKVIIQDSLPYFQVFDLNLNKEIGFLTYDFMIKNYPNTLRCLTIKQLQLNSMNN